MTEYNAGDAKLRIIPDAREFKQKLDADLEKIKAEYAVQVTAELARAREEIDRFRAEQHARAVDVPVKADPKSASEFEKLGEDWGAAFGKRFGSAFNLHFNATKIFGVPLGLEQLTNLLPGAVTGVVELAGAIQQLSQAGLALPGFFASAAASGGTFALGIHGLKTAFTDLGKASDGSKASVKAADEAMAKLSPNARDFLNTVEALKPQFKDLQQLDQNNLFAGLSQRLRVLADADMPHLRQGIDSISQGLNQNISQLFNSLGSNGTQTILDRIFGNTAAAQQKLTAVIDPFVHAMGTLSAAGTDSLPALTDGMAKLADRFDHFISAADSNGSLDKWINEGLTGFKQLGDILLNVGKSFTDITGALGGQGLIATLDTASKKMADFLGSAKGQEEMKKFFADGRYELNKIGDILHELLPLLPAVFQAAKDATADWLPLIKDATDILGQNPELIGKITEAFLVWKTISPVITALGVAGEALNIALRGAGPAAAEGAAGVKAAAAEEEGALTRVGGVAEGLRGKLAGIAGIIGALGSQFLPSSGGSSGYLNDAAGLSWFAGPEVGVPVTVADLVAQAGIATHQTEQRHDALQQHIAAANTPRNPTDITGPAAIPSIALPPGSPTSQAPPGFIDPTQILTGGSHAKGGPIQSGRGSGPTGGFLAEVHSNEWVLPAHARAAVGDQALWALTNGRSLEAGGFIGPDGNPITAGAAPGPATSASTTAGKTGSDTGSSSKDDPGKWLQNWGQQAVTGLGQALIGGVLGIFGLENSILSPTNTYNRDLQQTAGFYLGEKGPVNKGRIASPGEKPTPHGANTTGGTSSGGSGGSPKTPKDPTNPDSTVHHGGTNAAAKALPTASYSGGSEAVHLDVYNAFKAAGFDDAQWPAMVNLINGESGWRPTAKNPSSSAYGLFQFLDTTWATVGGSKTSDPVKQSEYGMQYIKGHYGNPSAAWSFWQSQSPHWYDEGGFLQPGLTLANNQTGKPEPVLTHDEGQSLKAVAQQGLAPQSGPSTKGDHAAPPPKGAQPLGVAPAPKTQEHNAPGVQTGITSAASAIGNAASMAASAAGAGIPGGGAAGPAIAGLVQQGGKIAAGAVNVLSSALVGNITNPNQGSPYGQTYRPQQNVPQTVQSNHGTTIHNMTVADPFEMRRALDVHDAQQQQSFLVNKSHW